MSRSFRHTPIIGRFPINRCHQRVVAAAPKGGPVPQAIRRSFGHTLTLNRCDQGVKPRETTEIDCAAVLRGETRGQGVSGISMGARGLDKRAVRRIGKRFGPGGHLESQRARFLSDHRVLPGRGLRRAAQLLRSWCSARDRSKADAVIEHGDACHGSRSRFQSIGVTSEWRPSGIFQLAANDTGVSNQ